MLYLKISFTLEKCSIFKYLKILKFHLSYGYESLTHVFSILSVLETVFHVSLEADLSQHLHGGEGEGVD
jgi:hypothetical protein